MSGTNPHQSINITGSQISNSQVGQSLGKQNQSLTQGSVQSSVSIDELIQSFSDLKELVKSSGLPDGRTNKALVYLTAAEEESKAINPDKEFAANSLRKVAETLEEADKLMSTSQNILERAKPVFAKILTWLGFASNFLI